MARRENESGNAYIFDVGDDYKPYPEDILGKTKNVIEDTGKCVNNLEIAQEKINYVYDDVTLTENELSIKASLYFDELRLFSLPPEYDLRVRPELYVTLFVPPEDKIEEIKRDATRSWKEKVLDPAKDMIDSALKKYTFNVTFSWINSHKHILLETEDGRCISLEWGLKDNRRVIGFSNHSKSKLIPYITYVVNPEYYDQELGLITGGAV